jgi:hypothetical protein
MRSVRKSLLVGVFSGAVLACGSENAIGPQIPDVVGTWHATLAQVTSVAHPATTMNLIAAGLTLQVVFATDHTFVSTTTTPGEPADISTGTYVETATKLTLNPTQGSTGEVWVFDLALSNGALVLTGATITFDFGTGEEASKLNLTLAH